MKQAVTDEMTRNSILTRRVSSLGFEENDRLREATERNQAERDARSNIDTDVIDVYPPGLLSDLKTMKAEIDLQFAKLMADPYQAPEIVDDFKSTIIRLYALLIENDIPIQDPKRKKSLDEVITEGLAELGGLLGAKGAIGAIKAKRAFRERFDEMRQSADFEIFQDPETGDYYFIDPETGDEVDCDRDGNPLWEDN